MWSSSPPISTRSGTDELALAQVKDEASVEAQRNSECWADLITFKECPMLEAGGEQVGDWEAAIKLSKKHGASISPTTEPDPHDALLQNHHRNLALVMQKTVDESPLPFVYDKMSAFKTFVDFVTFFTTADEVIRQLLAEAAAIPLDEVKP